MKEVLCFSRRTDGPANPQLLAAFVDSLKSGTVSWHNPLRRNQVCTRSTRPEDVLAISWWSKDYSNLIRECNTDTFDILCKYSHHFSFTINGPERSVLEPGLQSTLAERYEQLSHLVSICRHLRQNPDDSIMVHLDPIVQYMLEGSDSVSDNLGHVEQLFGTLSRLGLTRVHISFMQFCWAGLRKRLGEMENHIKFLCPDRAAQSALFVSKVLPWATRYGIRVQTCTAVEVHPSIGRGACVGGRDIASITSGVADAAKIQRPKTPGECVRNCTCFPHQDVGEKYLNKCQHGCR